MASTIYYTFPDLAQALGIHRNSLDERYRRAKARNWKGGREGLPKPDGYTPGGRPIWKESTLVRAGVLDGGEQQ